MSINEISSYFTQNISEQPYLRQNYNVAEAIFADFLRKHKNRAFLKLKRGWLTFAGSTATGANAGAE